MNLTPFGVHFLLKEWLNIPSDVTFSGIEGCFAWDGEAFMVVL